MKGGTSTSVYNKVGPKPEGERKHQRPSLIQNLMQLQRQREETDLVSIFPGLCILFDGHGQTVRDDDQPGRFALFSFWGGKCHRASSYGFIRVCVLYGVTR